MKKQLWVLVLLCVMGITAPYASQAQNKEKVKKEKKENKKNKPKKNKESKKRQQTGYGNQDNNSNQDDVENRSNGGRLDNAGVGQVIENLSRVDVNTLNYNNLTNESFVEVSDVMNDNQIRALNGQFQRNQRATDIQYQLNSRFRERNLLTQGQIVVGVLKDGRFLVMNQPAPR